VAPTVASAPVGEVGRLAAGTYQYKVSFVDNTGLETPQSAASQIILGQAGLAVRVSGLPTGGATT